MLSCEGAYKALRARLLDEKVHTTLHPTPYAMHPAPFTLHPAPYTLNMRNRVLSCEGAYKALRARLLDEKVHTTQCLLEQDITFINHICAPAARLLHGLPLLAPRHSVILCVIVRYRVRAPAKC